MTWRYSTLVTCSLQRTGVTLVEVLTVLGIIGMMAALLLPAVQYARNRSRSVACSSNLRQLGIAIAAYESQHLMLPPGSSSRNNVFVALLPFLERSDLAELADYNSDEGSTALNAVVVPVLICPADAATVKWAGTNYAACSGQWLFDTGLRFNGMFGTWDDSTSFDSGPVRSADVTDGLANTAALAEILRSNATYDRLRVIWEMPKDYDSGELDAFCAACGGLPAHPRSMGWKGSHYGRGVPWHRGGDFSSTFYNHALPPNEPTCLNRNHVPSALSPASSQHGGGVFVLFGDGHVAFVSQYVDVVPWRQMGGRDDGA